MEDDVDDFSKNVCQTSVSASSSWRSQRSHKIECHSLPYEQHIKATTTADDTISQGESSFQTKEDSRLYEMFYESDRLDCLRAQQQPVRERVRPATEFISLQCLLESQQLPTEEAEEHATSWQMEHSSSHIVQAILKDFCSSPTYVEEDLHAYDTPPYFRFRNKEIRVYSRRRLPLTVSAAIDDDDCMSCSSGLSMQEDFTTQVPITAHCAFDANSSQRICENLQNLSAFFTQNNANINIDLPNAVVRPRDIQIEGSMTSEQDEDATDILKSIGFCVGDTEQCKSLIVDCDIKPKVSENAEFTLFGESNSVAAVQDTPSKDGNPKNEDIYFCDDWFNFDFTPQVKKENPTQPEVHQEIDKVKLSTPCVSKQEIKCLNDWQTIHNPEKAGTSKDIEHTALKQQAASNDCNQLDFMMFSEWQPVAAPEFTEFRTASNKAIEVSEEKLKKAVSLLADIKVSYTQSLKEENGPSVESENKNCEHLDMIPFSEWQPVDMPETSSVTQKNLVEDVKLPTDSKLVAFKTASNKDMKLTKEMQKKAAMLLADLDYGFANQQDTQNDCQLNPIVEFRTASNKTVAVTEQMQIAAKHLMSDLEISSQKGKEYINNIDFLDGIPLSEWQPLEIAETSSVAKKQATEASNSKVFSAFGDDSTTLTIPEKVEFRSASNKIMEFTAEMQKRAKTLLADLESITVNQMESTTESPALHKMKLRERKKSEKSSKVEIISKNIALDTEIGVAPLTSEANDDYTNATPLQPKSLFVNFEFETPKTQMSLTQRSPLDQVTKSSIITRRNLLSLNKRRRQKRDTENENKLADSTPSRLCFAPMATATSTPVPSQKENVKNVNKHSPLLKRARSCSQDSPRVQRERVGKRRSEETLSPICAPTIKTRRLGLSRVRNKSAHDI